MRLFRWRSVFRGIAVAVIATAVTSSLAGAAQAAGPRLRTEHLDPGEEAHFHLTVPLRTFRLCVATWDHKPGESGQLRLAANDVPGSLPTLTVDDQHPTACTQFTTSKRWNKYTTTNISGRKLYVTVDRSNAP